MISDEMMTGYDIYKDLELIEEKVRAEGIAEGELKELPKLH